MVLPSLLGRTDKWMQAAAEELCAVLGASAGSEALVPFLQICDFVMLSRASHGTHELVEACRQGHFHLRLGERIGQRGRLLQGLAHAQTARHRQAVLFMLTWLIIPLVALPVVHALGGKPASSSQSGSEDPLSAAVLAGVSLALAAAAPRRLWAPIMMGQDRLPLNRIFGQLHDAAALRALPQRSGSDGRGACKLRAWAELRRVLVEERGLVTWAELRRALMEERGLVLVFRAVWIWTTVVFLVLPAVAPLDSMAVAAVISFSCPALILTSVFIMALAMSPRQQNEATSWLEIGQHMSRVWQFFFCLGSVCFGCLAQTQFWVIFFLASGFGPAVLLRHSCPAAVHGEISGKGQIVDMVISEGGATYCLLCVGPEGVPYDELLYGKTRRSLSLPFTPNPQWNMGAIIDAAGAHNPEVHIRVFSKNLFTEESCLGHAQVSLSKLTAAHKPTQLRLWGGVGFVRVSGGSSQLLAKHKVAASAMFPKLHGLGQLKTCMAKDATGDFPLRTGKAPLPAALRGVFWLSGQEDKSALASFFGPSNDGGGCSTGHLSGTTLKIRCGGDRCWAEASAGPADRHRYLDLTYNFVFDDAENPTKAQIYPEWKCLPCAMTQESVLDLEMILTPESEDFQGRIVWLRKSYVLGKEVEYYRYKLVQIICEDGDRIEPAFTKFVNYQNSINAQDASAEPGKLWYREV
ncbi:unnamed protein product [Polarella glacialis]|uniref:Uncharacterized protein n=1 Tax=Polarella glacialis TaxID=89957 RepID=A0A813FYS1_POLGL|nr:unnamed protein product [Polarella glacialis]